MKTDDEMYVELRDRLLGELHIGRLCAGDRLPSMRAVARESGVDHRVVARAYHELAAEGLVEVRGRSGVVVAAPLPLSGGERLHETEGWLTDLLVEAWARRIALPDLPRLLQRVIASGLRCACVESTEDHEVAICSELHEDFGLETRQIRLKPGKVDPAADNALLRRRLAHVDLVVTTAFHAAEVGPVANELGKQMIVASVNPALRRQIVHALERRDLRVVIADTAYADRAREYLRGFAEGTHYHLILWNDPRVRQALARPETALFTRAARRRLGIEGFHLLPDSVPFLSAETAGEVAGAMIRLGLAGAHADRTVSEP